jgi:hypothetical protein
MTTMRTRILIAVTVLSVLGALSAPASAHNEGIPSAPTSIKNMEHVQNVPNLSGNALDFFERKLTDGTIKRYAVAATQGNGFDILDVTEPAHPATVGRYLLPGNDPNKISQSSAGSNFHAWVSVNPVRNIVALTIEEGVNGVPAGHALRHNGSVGIQFVDISDVTNPKPLGKIDGLDGPHTVRMIGDNYAYTSLNTYVVDYTDPMNPKYTKKGIEGHEFYEDPNIPGRMYVGLAASAVGKWGTFNISSPGDPAKIGDLSDTRIVAAHEVYPAPDSSYVGVSDFTTGQSDASCPGGGLYFYDISGKRVSGASVSNPAKLGLWHAPFTGLAPDGTQSTPNYASCALHSWQHQPERSLAVAGLYAGGTWVFDPSGPTKTGGAYAEYTGVRGKTSWGNTLANVRDAADYVNATQWLPFDMATPDQERLIYVNGWGRGLDVYRYTGPLPAKQSRVTVDSQTTGGAVTGTLERFAVLTYQGWRNLPLADKTVQVTAGGQTVTAVTRADGSFAAPIALGAGANSVTVRWAGDDRFAPSEATRTVTN